MLNDSLEIEGDDAAVARAAGILDDYVALMQSGHVFNNGDLNSFLRVVTADPDASLRRLVESGKQRSFGKKIITPKTMNQRRYFDAIEHHDLVFGIGPAGTGKTYLAVAMAVSALLSKRVSRIVLTRPAVEAGERLGFLPGTLQEKVDPYLRPLYDALYDMIEAEKVDKLLERNTIEIAPLAFMRGRTLNDSFIIMDEAQNTSPEQMKMILTRQGFNSKMVVTGDVTQIDLPRGSAADWWKWWTFCATSKASASCSSTTATWCATIWCRKSSRPTSVTTKSSAPTASCRSNSRRRRPPRLPPSRCTVPETAA